MLGRGVMCKGRKQTANSFFCCAADAAEHDFGFEGAEHYKSELDCDVVTLARIQHQSHISTLGFNHAQGKIIIPPYSKTRDEKFQQLYH